MNGKLQYKSETWNLLHSEGLKLFLPRQHDATAIYYDAHWTFVPAGVDAANVSQDTPKLRVKIIGYVSNLRDWRQLENLRVGYHAKFGSDDLPEDRGPDLHIFLPDGSFDPGYASWETDLTFGTRDDRRFDLTLEGFLPSERVRKYRLDNNVKAFFGQQVPDEWEYPEWINEGEHFTFETTVDLCQIFCNVPINSPQPVELATQMARRELQAEGFSFSYVNGGDFTSGKYKREDGVCDTGRLIVLEFPSRPEPPADA